MSASAPPPPPAPASDVEPSSARSPFDDSAPPTVVSARRRFWAPEVIQTSAMDCGPAALKCLLEGYGIPVSYGRLREACQTSVDGTSIDALEVLAGDLGLVAEQILLPAEHVALPEAAALPAIAIVILPGGLTHFVVLWRRVGPYLQVMDPARGRRWVRAKRLERELYRHDMEVSAVDLAAFARSPGFAAALLARARRTIRAVALPEVRRALDAALAALPGAWQPLAAFDGAVRTIEALRESGIRVSRPQAERLLRRATTTPDRAELVRLDPVLALRASVSGPASAEHTKEDDVGEMADRLRVRGTVVVRILGRRGESRAADGGAGVALSRELAAALASAPSSLATRLLALVPLQTRTTTVTETALPSPGPAGPGVASDGARRRGGRRGAALLVLLAAAAVFAAAASVAVTLAARPLLSGHPTVGALGTLIAAVAVAGLLEGAVVVASRRLGRRFDVGLRAAFLRKLPRTSRQYFSSRPVSDLAERAHVAHRLAELPTLVTRVGRLFAEVALAAVVIAWLFPAGAAIAAGIWLSALAIMALALPVLSERDLRLRTHAGALIRYSLDALLGLLAIRTHGAAVSLARGHDVRLAEWRRAGRDLNRTALAAEAAMVALGALGSATLLASFARSGSALSAGSRLALLFLTLGLPNQVAAVILAWRRVPDARNVALRLIEPLGAPEDDAAVVAMMTTTASASASGSLSATATAQRGVALRLAGVSVEAAGFIILSEADLVVAPGTHVAIVGASGAGKSTLLGLLLGFHRPVTGALLVDDAPLVGARVAQLRRETAWVEPAVRLWNQTLGANLGYGRAGAPPRPAELADAIEAAELGDVVARLPEGIESLLGEAGGLLSGGEGQRVRFAREWMRVPHARLVLLDEPFRGLDRDARARLLSRARTRWRTATLLAVTHDVAHTQEFDRVLVIEGGRIAEDGVPGELAARPESKYRQLLDTDVRVRARRWADPVWRRLQVDVDRGAGVGRVRFDDVASDVAAANGPAAVSTP